MTQNEIKERVIKFTQNTLGKECCHKMCYAISYPLHIHLSNKEISNSLKAGSVNGIPHYWISLDLPQKLIIDATARQFDPLLDYVHFEKELGEESPNDFNKAFIDWSVPLIQYNRIAEELMKPARIPPLETYIKIGVKAALILINDKMLDEKNMNYIKVICQASTNFYRQHPEKTSDIDVAKKILKYCSENIR